MHRENRPPAEELAPVMLDQGKEVLFHCKRCGHWWGEEAPVLAVVDHRPGELHYWSVWVAHQAARGPAQGTGRRHPGRPSRRGGRAEWVSLAARRALRKGKPPVAGANGSRLWLELLRVRVAPLACSRCPNTPKPSRRELVKRTEQALRARRHHDYV